MRGVSWLVFVKYLVENNEIVKKYIIKSGLSVIDFCEPVDLYVRARVCARVIYYSMVLSCVYTKSEDNNVALALGPLSIQWILLVLLDYTSPVAGDIVV